MRNGTSGQWSAEHWPLVSEGEKQAVLISRSPDVSSSQGELFLKMCAAPCHSSVQYTKST